MKKFLVLFCSLFLAASGFAQNAVKFTYTKHDLGELTTGKEAECEFYYVFETDKAVNVTSLSSDATELISYGCSRNENNAKGFVRGRISCKFRSMLKGKHEVKLVVKTNFPSTDTLTILANVVEYPTKMYFDEGTRNFGILKFGEEKTMVYKFRFKKRENLTLYPINNDTVSISFCDPSEDGKSPGTKSRSYFSSWTGFVKDTFAFMEVKLKNLEGNSGKFERRIFIRESWSDSIPFDIWGEFRDDKMKRVYDKKTAGQGHITSYYTNGKPDSVRFYTFFNKLYRVYYYKDRRICSVKKTYEPGPKMELKSKIHDYGKINVAANGDCEFRFYNRGDAPLIISNVQSSCGCLVPSWPKEPFLPGDSGVIKAHYDTKRIGPFEKTLTVTCNDISNPQFSLRIKGQVYENFTSMKIDKAEIDAGDISFGEEKVFNVQFFNTGSGRLILDLNNYKNSFPGEEIMKCKIEKNKSTSNEKISFSSPEDDNGTITIRIKNMTGLEESFTERIWLKSNTDHDTVITIKGKFSGKPKSDSISEFIQNETQKRVFYYEKGLLTKVSYSYLSFGKEKRTRLYQEKYFVRGRMKEQKWIN